MKLSFLASIIIGILLALAYLHFYPIKLSQVPSKKEVLEPSFSLEKAPSQSLQGKIISFSGDTLWKSRTATAAAPLTTLIPILQGEELHTSEQGQIKLGFTGVTIAMAQEAALSVVQTLPTNLVFAQSSGSIIYKKTVPTPLTIRSLSLLINMPDTQSTATISVEESTITSTAQEGSLTLAFNTLENKTTLVTLKEGQTYVFDSETRHGVIE